MSSLNGVKAGMRLGSSFEVLDGSYSSLNSFDMNFLNLPVYRADTKEEFVVDYFGLLGTVMFGGPYGGIKYVAEKIESD